VEKADRRAAPKRLRGVGRFAVAARLEHPSSVAFGDTFSHKGRRKSQRADAPKGGNQHLFNHYAREALR